MGPHDMSVVEVVLSVVFGASYIVTLALIMWCGLTPCPFGNHEEPKIRMLHPKCLRCGKELETKEDT